MMIADMMVTTIGITVYINVPKILLSISILLVVLNTYSIPNPVQNVNNPWTGISILFL